MIIKSFLFFCVLMGGMLFLTLPDAKADTLLPVYPSTTEACQSFKDPTSCGQVQATVTGAGPRFKLHCDWGSSGSCLPHRSAGLGTTGGG